MLKKSAIKKKFAANCTCNFFKLYVVVFNLNVIQQRRVVCDLDFQWNPYGTAN
jgi:hypothetical protein